MMLERNNKVTNVGRVKFTKLVLDVFQLLTLEKLHCAIIRIIKHVTCQEGLGSTEGNQRDICIRRAINFFCDQPSSLLNRLSTFSIRNKMVMNTKMNCCSWHKLKSVHNIIYLPTTVNNIGWRRMTKFASKQGRRRNHCHLTSD